MTYPCVFSNNSAGDFVSLRPHFIHLTPNPTDLDSNLELFMVIPALYELFMFINLYACMYVYIHMKTNLKFCGTKHTSFQKTLSFCSGTHRYFSGKKKFF